MGIVCLVLGLSSVLRLFGFATDAWLSDSEIHHVVGERANVSRDTSATEPLDVITWNIERGTAYESILAALRLIDADIVLLQEVDRGCARTGYRDVARDLARALDMNWVFAGEFQEIGEARGDRPATTGQAILSKFPIGPTSVLRFTAQDRWRWSINPVQPRRGGRMALKAETGGILVYDTHIESGGNETLQRRQIAEILADYRREAMHDRPVLIGGDFNNGPILRATMFGTLSAAEFADALGESGERGPTSFGQRHPIDWIFVKNVMPVLGTGRIVDTRAASDHFPVLAALAAGSAQLVPR
jgi:endonuclease/exonuclease/phosphatase family metal-dependent hydrolase